MLIRNIKHKGLKQFVENNQAKNLPAAYCDKIRDILSYLIEMEMIEEIQALRKYKPHILKGDRVNTYSLSVTPNWRITFQYDETENEIFDLNYEDYY